MPFHHHGHMNAAPLVKAGQQVRKGQLIGYVGKSGTDHAHNHYEVSKAKPPSWVFYPKGKTMQWVKDHYEDPRKYINEALNLPSKWGNKAAGLKYLEYYQPHNVFHPGIDINDGAGNADLGNPIRSTVDGVVRFTGNNAGWGHHIWIEEKTINEKTMIRRIRHQGTEYIDFNGAEAWGIADPAFAKFLDNAGIPIEDVATLPPHTHNITMPRWTIERK